MDSKVIRHRCPRIDGYTSSGIVDFETDEEGYTTARCRGCGTNLSQAIVLDEIKKCVCLCANCHRIKHFLISNEQHFE